MPHPHLTELYKIYQSETQPFRKVHRMIDLFESLIKMHTVVIIAEYVGYNKLSDAAKGMLAQGLRTPSLGTWQLFSRILFEELQQDDYQWTFNGFASDFIQLDKSLNASKTNVIAFRNGYAHGATPTDAQCSSDISQFEPFLLQLLQSPWLQSTHTEHRDQQVWISTDTGQLCLHPILLFKEEGGASPYAFFNDLKNDKVGLLNYPLSKHYREKDFYKEFHQYLPLHEWKKSGNNEFYQRIEELTETFKGRSAERERLLQFVTSRNKGYLSIQGNPGIGKSALIARFFKDLKANEQTKSIQVVEYFIRRGTAQAQVDYLFNYLIRRTDELFPEGREIRAEGRATWELQQQLFSKWRLWSEKSNGSKLLMLIDGLDEGTENNVVTYLPRENFEGILIIYGSRPGGHKSIDELWTQLPVEHHDKLELTGLGKSDIRALIYEVSNKYELDRESEWIDAVQQRSQGNPLYLKLLCDAIEQGSIALNDIHALPEKIDEYYKAILDRYAADVTDGDALLNALFTFAAAKDYLTMAHIGLINRLGEGALQRIGSTLKEVLYENPLTEAVLDYQLFHESFREYLIEKKSKQVNDAAERIIDFCNGWKELEGSWEQRYALEHLSIHLSESKKEVRSEALIRLMYDQDYVQTQQKVLKQFEASNVLYRHALKKAGALKREEDMLEAALSLVDLKYAEANDAPQVVAMVATGDIDHALKRIEQFGGSDKEGMQRKFTLYMLCLMELTLLDSKDKPFRKSVIEKLLNHLDENIPVDHSLLKWNDFFPSYLMFLMACEWAEMGLDYMRVYKRTDEWESNWITQMGSYGIVQLDILIETIHCMSSRIVKRDALVKISIVLAKQNYFEKALDFTQKLNDDYNKNRCLEIVCTKLIDKGYLVEAIECIWRINNLYVRSKLLISISTEFYSLNEFEKAELLIQKAIVYARKINNKFLEIQKCTLFQDISIELIKQGKGLDSDLIVKEALEYARNMDNEVYKCEVLIQFSLNLRVSKKIHLAEMLIEESIEIALKIIDKSEKVNALNCISIELLKQGNIKLAVQILNQSLDFARVIHDNRKKDWALVKISITFAKLGNFEQAIECAHSISNDEEKSEALWNISVELSNQDKLNESAIVFQEALESAQRIIYNFGFGKRSVIKRIIPELSKLGRIADAYACIDNITMEVHKWEAIRFITSELSKNGYLNNLLVYIKNKRKEDFDNAILMSVSDELAKKGELNDVAFFIKGTLVCNNGKTKPNSRTRICKDISNGLIELDKKEQAKVVLLQCLNYINNIYEEWLMSDAIINIYSELIQVDLSDEILKCISAMRSNDDKCKSLIYLARHLKKHGKYVESFNALNQAFYYSNSIDSVTRKCKRLLFISSELYEHGKIEESKSVFQNLIDIAENLGNTKFDDILLETIAIELAYHGEIEHAYTYLNRVKRDLSKSKILMAISYVLAKQKKFKEAISCVRDITDLNEKSLALVYISSELKESKNLIDANEMIGEALKLVDMAEKTFKNFDAIVNIAGELAKQGNIILAEKIAINLTRIADRHDCWEYIAKKQKNQFGSVESLNIFDKFQSEEAQIFYLKGWAESVNVDDISPELAHDAMLALVNDSTSLEHFLQVYAQYELFFGNPSKEKIDRLNKSLNIQWTLDIIAQFPKEQKEQRLSTNLSEWIDQIPDEDDREEIELLARKVAKGKMTEEEFGERLKEF